MAPLARTMEGPGEVDEKAEVRSKLELFDDLLIKRNQEVLLRVLEKAGSRLGNPWHGRTVSGTCW